MPENRDITGKKNQTSFKPGQSGNPGGRPAATKEFRERCREFMSETGFQTLVDMANSQKDKDRFRAIELIAGYGLGKPKQGVELAGEDGGGITIVYQRANGDSKD